LNLRGNIIGDSLRESALFEYLKKTHKGCFLATTGGSIVKVIHENNPFIDEFIELKELNILSKKASKIKKAFFLFRAMLKAYRKMRGFDVCVLTQRHRYPYKLLPLIAGLKIIEKNSLPFTKYPCRMYFNKDEENAVKKYLGKNEKKRIAVDIESNDTSRCWSTHNFSMLIGLLLKRKYSVYLLGIDRQQNSPIIEKFGKKIQDIVGKTPIRESASLLKKMDFYVGNDSGLSHVAAAVDTSSLTILIDSVVDIFNDPKKSRAIKLRKPSVNEAFKAIDNELQNKK
ncbi:MAG: glycosyltransferase family 9 protein, partial [Candidatus Woesearchaeota archaeon]